MENSGGRSATIFVLLTIAAVFLMHVKHAYVEVDYVVSSVDGRRYLVQNKSDKAEAARLLGRVNRRLQRLVRHMRAKFPEDPDVAFLARNFNPDNVSEGSQEDGYTSYSVSKGERLVLCLRTDSRLERINTIMYVAIHELGHLMTREYGHPPAYWANFDRLLREAVEIGLYRKQDYGANPQSYCGIEIDSSILYPGGEK